MLTGLLLGLAAILGAVLLVTLVNAFTAPMLKNAPAVQNMPAVSVLVPARNEEKNIGDCLSSLIRQNYSNFEILVLDDNSTDQTAAVVRQFSVQDNRIKLIEGAPLPAGWLGKTWACHQLAERAKGEIFIFTDADNRYAPRAILHTVGWMQKLNLGLLSGFCHQITKTLPEKLAVPVVNMLVYSYLPLWLTYYSKAPSLAAANGQWLAFTRAAYQKIGGHRAVRHHVVEDVELSRLAKRGGEKILAVSAKDEVFSRMYHSGRQVWEGYSKNLFGLMNFKTLPFFIVLTLLSFIHIAPYILVWFKPATTFAQLAIAMNILIRLILSVKFAQPLLVSTLLHPVSMSYTILIGLNSYRWHKTGRIKWKGRLVEAGVA
ncbi:MAG: glycosyltransferase family 2 protein [candidate division KSB1 bacterium]|nr:glycosyltransferase family 2 protein [candidate division KSB1 bacterium]MDZ7366443.1 glycosyltransferase family 2 protein [candidate division KSB1 bacterium]MDZ7404595.1 glycosyltransferase family 2 protein [candidate division KSB1 bacterium]